MNAEKPPKPPSDSTENQMLIIGTFLDTTWRMFVPILVCTLIGYGVDKMQNTLPTGVLVGMVIGIILSIMLVYQQYKKVKHGSK
jgi:F0F1-type ATP synthase assembly protein I